MDCADEVRLIESKLGNLPGVTKLEFDLVRQRLVVEGSIAVAEIQRGVKELGMAARLEGEEVPTAGIVLAAARSARHDARLGGRAL